MKLCSVHPLCACFHSQRCRHAHFLGSASCIFIFFCSLYLPQSIHHPAVCTHTHTTKAANEQECPQISETARQLSQQGVLLLVGCCSQPVVACNQTMACPAFPATDVLILYSKRQGGGGWTERSRGELGGRVQCLSSGPTPLLEGLLGSIIEWRADFLLWWTLEQFPKVKLKQAGRCWCLFNLEVLCAPHFWPNWVVKHVIPS